MLTIANPNQITMTNTPPQVFKDYIENANLTMLPHQIIGVNWCLSKEDTGVKPTTTHPRIRAGLIADEMGLGKTIQIIGTMLCNLRTRTLIVLPRALIEQWHRIIKTTTNLSVILYHGPKRDKIPIAELKSYQVVITTYGLISTHSIAPNNPKDPNNKAPTRLHGINWSRVIFDEAHHIRNKTTAAHNGAKKLSTKISWLITGTPIQNSIEDLHSLQSVMGLTPAFYKDPDTLTFFINEFLLKRTKAEVNLNLPNLVQHQEEVPWNNESEKRLAQEIHARLKFSNTIAPTNAKLSTRLPKSALPLLTRSRQLCVLPKLAKKKLKELKNEPQPQTHDQTQDQTQPTDAETERFIDEATGHTSKLSAVIKQIIKNKKNGKNKLLFCHYHDEIDYIKLILNKVGFKTDSFDGRTPQNERESILTMDSPKTPESAGKNTPESEEKKQNQNRVLILQINTGCEGLNLQQYSEIYFISPHWNPAIEDQAIARAYRIGQTQETHVYRFIMSPFDEEKKSTTLDEHAMNIQETKREIMNTLTIA